MHRDGDDVTVRCLINEHSWRLTCVDGRWQGVIGNCSQCKRDVMWRGSMTLRHEHTDLQSETSRVL